MPRGASRFVRKAFREALSTNGETSPRGGYSSGDEKGPRSFPPEVKIACWEKAAVVDGRDPARWRRDVAGNLIFRRLNGCEGCLCFEYDHVHPFSKGGPSTLENCQVLQSAANRAKANRVGVTTTELQQKSLFCKLPNRDMDTVEFVTYGNIIEGEKSAGGCRIS